MRILIFSNWFPPVISGSSYYTCSLAQTLTDRGHDVVVITLDWGKEYVISKKYSFNIVRIPVIRFPRLPVFYNLRLMGLSFTPNNLRMVKQLIKRHNSQIIHLVNHIFDTNFLCVAASHLTNVPIVGSITTPIQHQNHYVQRLMGIADRMIVGLFGVCKWDGIVSLDNVVRDYVGRVYGSITQGKSVVIPFGIQIESLPRYSKISGYRSIHPQILMIGHIHPFRNPVQLVRAMPYVLREVPEARLILAGRVDLQEPVVEARRLGLTEDQVRFLGETPSEDVIRLMQTSHVFASWVTGPYHSLGTAPMEAMMCETPVINDLPENLFGEGKLKNWENIVLINSRDPESIAGAIIRLLKDEELRQRIGAAGRRFVMEHLSWDGIAKQMEEFYMNILEKREMGIKSG